MRGGGFHGGGGMHAGRIHGGGGRGHNFAGRPHPSHLIAGRPGRPGYPIAGRPGRPIAGYPGGYYPGWRGAAAVGAAAVGAAYYDGYYNNGCYNDAYGQSVCPAQDYGARNGFVCQPGTMVKLDDGREYPCQ
jgi:hypothetical protein